MTVPPGETPAVPAVETPAPPNTATPEGRAQVMTQYVLNNPAQIPAKFKTADGAVNVDALTASYLALEQGQSAAGATTPSSASPPSNANTLDSALVSSPDTNSISAVSPEAVPDSLADALNAPAPPTEPELWKKAGEEFATTGSITETTAKALVDHGVPLNMIAAAVSGQKAIEAAGKIKAQEMVGGADELKATLDWARDTLTDAEKASIQPLLRGPSAETVLMGLHQRRLSAQPAPTGQVNTANVATPVLAGQGAVNVVAFESWAEQEAAMRDPKYKADPEYRRGVEARIVVGAGNDPNGLL